MEVVPISHVYVEEEIFDPDSWIGCPIVLFDVYGFKPVREVMFHYFVCETNRVSGPFKSSRVVSNVGG